MEFPYIKLTFHVIRGPKSRFFENRPKKNAQKTEKTGFLSQKSIFSLRSFWSGAENVGGSNLFPRNFFFRNFHKSLSFCSESSNLNFWLISTRVGFSFRNFCFFPFFEIFFLLGFFKTLKM